MFKTRLNTAKCLCLALLCAYFTFVRAYFVTRTEDFKSAYSGPCDTKPFCAAWVCIDSQNVAIDPSICFASNGAFCSKFNNSETSSIFHEWQFEPAPRDIQGVKVTVTRLATSPNCIEEGGVFLVVRNSLLKAQMSSSSQFWSSYSENIVYGGEGDTWGVEKLSWDDFVDSNFGVLITSHSSAFCNGSLTKITLEVYSADPVSNYDILKWSIVGGGISLSLLVFGLAIFRAVRRPSNVQLPSAEAKMDVHLTSAVDSYATSSSSSSFYIPKTKHMDNIPVEDLSLEQKIHEGMFAQVYRGFNRGDRVAILKIQSFDDATTDAIWKELGKHVGLSHPNVVYNWGVSAKPLSLVVEYVEGGSLKRILRDKKSPLKAKAQRNMVSGILEGLKFLHNNNIIHRDLNPSNILVTHDLKPKITNYGFARAITSLDTPLDFNKIAIRYMAPEVITNSSFTSASDIWSFGILVHQMVTKKKPFFEEQKIQDILQKIAFESSRLQWTEEQELENPELNQLRKNCLQVNPLMRPGADEMSLSYSLSFISMDGDLK